ncbi:ABC transporter permease [Rhizobium sp. 768_B6_N1_8]|uniref:ABC transporter permease n=1 Tax=unclassified Rhizobium TaxID=2613769 RepID=UPI003F2457D3
MRQKVVIAVAATPLLAFVGYPLSMLLVAAVGGDRGTLGLGTLIEALTNPVYLTALFSTLGLCAGTAVVSVAVALPVSLFAWSRSPRYLAIVLILIILPMFMSYIVKIYTMRSLLGLNGFFNQLLVGTGILHEPSTLLLFNRGAILATFVVLYIPFATLPIYLSLERIPASLALAARDLGASYGQTLRDVVLPLATPGIVSAALFSFILALGDFITPQMVGGPNGMTFGRIVWSQFGLAFNYPLGAALGLLLLGVTLIALAAAGVAAKLTTVRSI